MMAVEKHHSNIPSSTAQPQKIYPSKPSFYHYAFSHSLLTNEVINHPYEGSGTEEDPYVVNFAPNDPRNPRTWSRVKRWGLVLMVSVATLAVAFASTAYSGSIEQIVAEFACTPEVATLGRWTLLFFSYLCRFPLST